MKKAKKPVKEKKVKKKVTKSAKTVKPSKTTKNSKQSTVKTPKNKKTNATKNGGTKKSVALTSKVKVTKPAAPELTTEELRNDVVLDVPVKKGYLSNSSLLRELEVSRRLGKMSNKLAIMLKLLCDRYAKKANFIGYTFNDDMRAYALLMLVRMWDRFDPTRSNNPFAYFTQCIKHSFQQYLNQEKKQREIRDELLVDQGMLPSYTYMNDHGDGGDHYLQSSPDGQFEPRGERDE